jgi:hypothetical protein
MSGRPYTYSRAMAIAQLMRDQRRPVMSEVGKHVRQVFKFGEDLFVSYSDTIDWVPKLSKLSRYGREAHYLTEEQRRDENPESKIISWGTQEIKPIEGWPTEEEIAEEIAASTEREKNWNGSLGDNDRTAFERLQG